MPTAESCCYFRGSTERLGKWSVLIKLVNRQQSFVLEG
uniref:Uncharacterized protein n=1 Tax=Arundo donax TaxID=35708 RepID=A0A0A9AK55_ARUDO